MASRGFGGNGAGFSGAGSAGDGAKGGRPAGAPEGGAKRGCFAPLCSARPGPIAPPPPPGPQPLEQRAARGDAAQMPAGRGGREKSCGPATCKAAAGHVPGMPSWLATGLFCGTLGSRAAEGWQRSGAC